MASAAAWSRSSSAQLLLFLAAISTCFLLPCLSLDAHQGTNNSSIAVGAAAALPPFSFSFNFTNPSSYNSSDLLFEGSASVAPDKNVADLTCNSRDKNIYGCTGRMSYNHPVPLYNKNTAGGLSSFSTSFTFVIRVDNGTDLGDGMAFFLSRYPSRMPPGSSGGTLGLINQNKTLAYGDDQFVAVEFDTYSNTWDPHHSDYRNHIGIDINSIFTSWNTTSLPQGQTLNGTWTATVKFDGNTSVLSVSVRSLDDPSVLEPFLVTLVLTDIDKVLPPEVAVGFSASTGVNKELNQILAWSFNSTLPAPPSPSPTTQNKDNIIVGAALIIVGAALALVLLVVMWTILSCWKWKNRQRGFEKLWKHQPTRFEYNDLAAATGRFSEERKLGEGFFGVVYRGYLKKLGCEVAIKEIKSQAAPGPKDSDFNAELKAITSVNHKNLVKLVGWCRGNSCNFMEFICWSWKNERLFLVYELVPNGSLHEHLHNKEKILPWETRYKIVKNITCALLYLHHECDPLILHRDIKPGNILLDANFNAKLADFGLSRIVDPDSSRVQTIAVGTEGYLDPVCKMSVGKVEFSRSSDVYSYGIVLLEIACRQRMSRDKVWQHYSNRCLPEAADDRLKGELHSHRSQIESVIILGLWCSYDDNKKRPSMEQVMGVLEHGKPLPDLNLLDTASVPTQQETYIDLPAPSSAGSGSSSYEQHA